MLPKAVVCGVGWSVMRVEETVCDFNSSNWNKWISYGISVFVGSRSSRLLFALSHHRLPRLLRPQQLLWPQQLQRRQLPPLRQLLPLCPQHRQEECGIRPGYRVSVCLQIGAGETRVYAFLCLHLWESAHKKLLQNKITVWPCDHVLVIVKICGGGTFSMYVWPFVCRDCIPLQQCQPSHRDRQEWSGADDLCRLKHCNHTSSNDKLDGVCSQARDGTDFPLPRLPWEASCTSISYLQNSIGSWNILSMHEPSAKIFSLAPFCFEL